MNANIFEKAHRVIQACDAAYLGVIDETGGPSVSTVSPIRPENIFEAYFATGLNVNKTRRLLKDNRASVCYRLDNDNITLVGHAEILTDQPSKSKYWLDWFINHIPGGETDPNYCVIKFTTQRVSLWIDHQVAEFTIEDFLKVQSRCGLLCSWCEYREPCGCGGCVETKGNPFHGECPVAVCCQDKGYEHCGQCEALPGQCAQPDCKKIDDNGFYMCGGCGATSCDKLYPYSYRDPEHGDNPPGARIEVCKAWAKWR